MNNKNFYSMEKNLYSIWKFFISGRNCWSWRIRRRKYPRHIETDIKFPESPEDQIINSYRAKKNKGLQNFVKNFKTAQEFKEFLKERNEEIKDMTEENLEIVKTALNLKE